MKVCDFCSHLGDDTVCGLGLQIPKSMSCREFGPTMEKFCADPKDFADPRQILQMATFFGIKGPELKKVRLMASQEETNRVTEKQMSALQSP